MSRIMAFDPGGTTGVATVDTDGWISQWQVSQDAHHIELWNILNDYLPDIVVCESFQYRAHLPHAVLISRDYIGVITLWCQLEDVELYMQTPASAKKLWSDDKVKKLGLWKKGQPHANDAMRHLLYYKTVTEKDMSYVQNLK